MIAKQAFIRITMQSSNCQPLWLQFDSKNTPEKVGCKITITKGLKYSKKRNFKQLFYIYNPRGWGKEYVFGTHLYRTLVRFPSKIFHAPICKSQLAMFFVLREQYVFYRRHESDQKILEIENTPTHSTIKSFGKRREASAISAPLDSFGYGLSS